MLIPSAEMITSAKDQLTVAIDEKVAKELKELHAVYPDASIDFKKGYIVGLQTARVALKGNVTLATHNVNPSLLL